MNNIIATLLLEFLNLVTNILIIRYLISVGANVLNFLVDFIGFHNVW